MSPRNEEQNAIIKDERREQILSAALHVFARRGFAATKISDIVSRAGMSHGLVYHYFSSKEEIFYVLLKRAVETSTNSLVLVDATPLSPIEKVRQLARYILGGVESYADSAYYFLIVNHASTMEAPPDVQNLFEVTNTSLQTMSRILKEGQEAGEVREGDTMGMTMAFFAAIQGLAMYKLAVKDFHMPDPELLVHIVEK